MADTHAADEMTAIEVACDADVSGCVFRMRTEADDKDRLLEITREHVAERHGQEYSLDQIEDKHVAEVSV